MRDETHTYPAIHVNSELTMEVKLTLSSAVVEHSAEHDSKRFPAIDETKNLKHHQKE